MASATSTSAYNVRTSSGRVKSVLELSEVSTDIVLIASGTESCPDLATFEPNDSARPVVGVTAPAHGAIRLHLEDQGERCGQALQQLGSRRLGEHTSLYRPVPHGVAAR